MTARLPRPLIDLAAKVQHDATDPLRALLAELGGSAFQQVLIDPDHNNPAPGAALQKKR